MRCPDQKNLLIYSVATAFSIVGVCYLIRRPRGKSSLLQAALGGLLRAELRALALMSEGPINVVVTWGHRDEETWNKRCEMYLHSSCWAKFTKNQETSDLRPDSFSSVYKAMCMQNRGHNTTMRKQNAGVILTLGSHTGKFKLLSSGCFKSTGFGHSLQEDSNEFSK